MANTWINETENDIEELQSTHADITECTPLRNKLYYFKGFQEKREEKQELFELKKRERETQGKNERYMEGKEKGRKKAFETNVVHSGV